MMAYLEVHDGNRQTDRPTLAGCRVAWHATNKIARNENEKKEKIREEIAVLQLFSNRLHWHCTKYLEAELLKTNSFTTKHVNYHVDSRENVIMNYIY